MEKSAILTWTQENINQAPSSVGVCILRSTPVNGDIISIQVTEDIKKTLKDAFIESSSEVVNFFDWYKTENIDEAQKIKEELVQRHHLISVT